MFDIASVERRLPVAGLGRPLLFEARVGSTQSLAGALAAAGAAHGTLVVADEQTEGRGRHGRRWLTPAGSALAFSLILRPGLSPGEARSRELAAWNLVGAVAVSEALEGLGAQPQIKWPNDVLLGGRKVAGVLLEISWIDQRLDSLVLGIGANVHAGSVPPASEVDFPTTCVEEALGRRPSREDLLVGIVQQIGQACDPLDPARIVAKVNQRLAFLGRPVRVTTGTSATEGRLVAVGDEGEIVIRESGGRQVSLAGGDPHLRPLDDEAE
jgi:BirA family transcriptional regulator, biotin operon repressor / biotin---[acetyl-CoA-carboxylase] ligase